MDTRKRVRLVLRIVGFLGCIGLVLSGISPTLLFCLAAAGTWSVADEERERGVKLLPGISWLARAWIVLAMISLVRDLLH